MLILYIQQMEIFKKKLFSRAVYQEIKNRNFFLNQNIILDYNLNGPYKLESFTHFFDHQ